MLILNLNTDENILFQNPWGTTKAVLRDKLIALNTQWRRTKTNELKFNTRHHKKSNRTNTKKQEVRK